MGELVDNESRQLIKKNQDAIDQLNSQIHYGYEVHRLEKRLLAWKVFGLCVLGNFLLWIIVLLLFSSIK